MNADDYLQYFDCEVVSLAFNNVIATVDKQSQIKIFDLNFNKIFKPFSINKEFIYDAYTTKGKIKRTDIDIIQNGKLLIVGSKKGCWLVDNEKKNVLREIIGHEDNAVRAVSFSSSGKFLATGGYDGKCKIWEVSTGREISSFEKHPETDEFSHIQSIKFSPSNKLIISTGEGSCRIWEARNAKELLCINGCGTYAEFSSDSNSIVCTDRLTIKFFSLDGIKKIESNEFGSSVVNFSFSNDSEKLAVVTFDGKCKIFNVNNFIELKSLELEMKVLKIFWVDTEKLIGLLNDGRTFLWRMYPTYKQV